MKCKKKKLNKFNAMLILAQSDMQQKYGNTKRKEERCYFCYICKAYHVTKKKG
jgi:hypothetical protein